MTYEQIAREMPDEFAARKRDKLRYRWVRYGWQYNCDTVWVRYGGARWCGVRYMGCGTGCVLFLYWRF